MNPEQIAKSGTEHAEQAALFCWANMAQKCGFEMADMMESYAHRVDVDSEGLYKNPVLPLKWLHAIPNAGARGNRVAASQLKAEGVKAGVADILLPVKKIVTPATTYANGKAWAEHAYSGLYIELKRSNGRMSDLSSEQHEFGKFVLEQGYAWAPAFGWHQAASFVKDYLSSWSLAKPA